MPRGSHVPWFVGFVLALPALGATRVAAAQPIDEPIRVSYAAAPACPDREALLAQVYARTGRARAPRAGEAARELDVRIEEQGGKYRGRLEVAASGASPTQQREVTGATCGELVEVLAFFIALAIDPSASAAPAPPATATPPATPSPPPPSKATPPPPATPRRPTARRRSAGRKAPSSLLGGGWLLEGGSGPALVGGVAPNALLGERAVVGVTKSGVGRSLFSPSLSLAGVSTATGQAKSAAGTLALRWQALVGSVCPVAVHVSTITLRPCAAVELGTVRGEGVGLRRATRNLAPWTAVGLAARGELPLGWRLFIELELGLSAPLVAPRFRFTSGVVAYDSALVGGRATLAFTLRL